MSKRLGTVVALLLVAAIIAGCGGGGGSQQSTTPSSSSSSSSSSNAQRIEIIGTEFAYSPGNITVKRGQAVEIVFKNEGSVVHDLLIDEFKVNSGKITAGQSTTLRFTPNQAGQYQIYCAEPGHQVAGMVATLVVE